MRIHCHVSWKHQYRSAAGAHGELAGLRDSRYACLTCGSHVLVLRTSQHEFPCVATCSRAPTSNHSLSGCRALDCFHGNSAQQTTRRSLSEATSILKDRHTDFATDPALLPIPELTSQPEFNASSERCPLQASLDFRCSLELPLTQLEIHLSQRLRRQQREDASSCSEVGRCIAILHTSKREEERHLPQRSKTLCWL